MTPPTKTAIYSYCRGGCRRDRSAIYDETDRAHDRSRHPQAIGMEWAIGTVVGASKDCYSGP